jgi:hypothetical protein
MQNLSLTSASESHHVQEGVGAGGKGGGETCSHIKVQKAHQVQNSLWVTPPTAACKGFLFWTLLFSSRHGVKISMKVQVRHCFSSREKAWQWSSPSHPSLPSVKSVPSSTAKNRGGCSRHTTEIETVPTKAALPNVGRAPPKTNNEKRWNEKSILCEII